MLAAESQTGYKTGRGVNGTQQRIYTQAVFKVFALSPFELHAQLDFKVIPQKYIYTF